MDRVDWDLVRAELRSVSTGELLAILGRAYAQLDPDEIPTVLGSYFDYGALRAREQDLGSQTLHQKMTTFHRDSVMGRYYQSFDVNSRNCTQLSGGTETWIDEAVLFFDRAAETSRAGDQRQARAVFELLWDLMERIDRCERVVFFADEHGSWQVWVDYRRVLPAYFASLVATAKPEVFATRVVEIIERHDRGQRAEAFDEARATASGAHLKSLDAAIQAARDERLARDR